MGKEKKKAAIRWWSDWTVLWVIGGLVLTYFVFISEQLHPGSHPVHWLVSILGGGIGFGIGLFVDIGLLPFMRSLRRNSGRTIIKPVKGKRRNERNR
ncbi:MAG: hypothetical protein IIB13_05275 [Chloroflexi bacterium]|nr:hypothetical protein [Chloroflexota bacterium]